MLKITIPGNPISKNEKIRVGKHGQFYSPTRNQETVIAWDIYCQYQAERKKLGILPRDPRKPLTIHVNYFYKEKRRDQYPDETNLNSFLADAMQKSFLVYNDKILKIIVDKYEHSKEIKGRTEIIINSQAKEREKIRPRREFKQLSPVSKTV